jgi:hypothetical protein
MAKRPNQLWLDFSCFFVFPPPQLFRVGSIIYIQLPERPNSTLLLYTRTRQKNTHVITRVALSLKSIVSPVFPSLAFRSDWCPRQNERGERTFRDGGKSFFQKMKESLRQSFPPLLSCLSTVLIDAHTLHWTMNDNYTQTAVYANVSVVEKANKFQNEHFLE